MSAVESVAKKEALSVQEQAIASGEKALHPGVTDRVLRLFDAIRASYQPQLTLDRAVYFTESMRSTEGQPLVLRWARALKHITENIPVTIFDDELIVGRPNTWLGRYTLVYPELDGSVMPAGVEMFRKRNQCRKMRGSGWKRSGTAKRASCRRFKQKPCGPLS